MNRTFKSVKISEKSFVRKYGGGHHHHHGESHTKLDRHYPLTRTKEIQEWAFQKEHTHRHWRIYHKGTIRSLLIYGLAIPALFWIAVQKDLVKNNLTLSFPFKY